MLFRDSFDLIFSLGEACSCTQALRDAHLQFFSYPFDWLYGADFKKRTEILESGFSNFIEKNDLEYSHMERSISCTAYHNKLNDITFNHDFKKDVPFDEMYLKVKNKYDRRIDRLLNQIRNSNKVLAVYIQTPDNLNEIPNEELINTSTNLKKTYPSSNINLLYLFNKNQVDYKNAEIKQISDSIYKAVFDYNSYDQEFPYTVNRKILELFFNKIKITNKNINFANKVKRHIYLLQKQNKEFLWKKH